MARPSLYTPELIEAICADLEQGIPLTHICAGDDMPAPRTVRAWEAEMPEVAAAIARARELGEVALAEQCLTIADDEHHDWVMTKKGEVTNEVAIGRAKLQIDTRLKLLAKFNPKKWGDKQQVEHTGKLSLESLVAGSEPAAE
jgi:hypothetical protein